MILDKAVRLLPACRSFCKPFSDAPKSKFNEEYVKRFSKNEKKTNKISIIGIGQVGISCCAFLLAKRLTNELVMVDIRKDWAQAEALEFLHASSVLGSPKVVTCTDGKRTAGSKYIIVTAGARPGGLTRLQIAQDTIDMLKKIVPNVVEKSPKATYIVCSNPADVMTWAIQQLTGLPKKRCISSGCHLDSMRFRFLIGNRLGVAASEVTAFMIGEHGESAVPVWSSVNVGGVSLLRIMPDIGTDKDRENWKDIHKNVVSAAGQVSKVKGYTSWAVGLAVTDIIDAMAYNSGRILSVGTDVQGLMGIEDSVVLSLPCVLDSEGVRQVVQLPLTKFEMCLLKKSSDILVAAQCNLKL